MEFHVPCKLARSAGAVEYTECISAVGKTSIRVSCYDIKPSDGKAPALEFWETGITSSLSLLSDPLYLRVEAFDRALSMGQIEQTK